MTTADQSLLDAAQDFAEDIADLLSRTIAEDPPIRAQVLGGRVVVGGFDQDGQSVDIPLLISGQHRLNLRISFRCSFDFTGAFLAIEQSEFALLVPYVRHPVVRFDYVRERAWDPLMSSCMRSLQRSAFCALLPERKRRRGGFIYRSVDGGSALALKMSSSSQYTSSV